MTDYLHVVIESSDRERPLFLFGDLSERELRQKFLRNYQLGKPVMIDNRVVDLGKVTSVQIIETPEPLDDALKRLQKESYERIDRFNRESDSVVICSAGSGWQKEDIVECGNQVTGTYVSGPPGEGTWLTQVGAILHNPWVLSVGGGIALIVLGTIIKKWFTS